MAANPFDPRQRKNPQPVQPQQPATRPVTGTPTYDVGNSPMAATPAAPLSTHQQINLLSGGKMGQPKKSFPEPTSASGPSLEDQEGSLYRDIMQSHENAWGGIEQGHKANMATMQRRAAATNAAMGRSIGGGFWSNLGQAQISGQGQLDQARLEHGQQSRNLQMDWLDKMIRRRERDEDLAERAAYSGDTGAPQLPGPGETPTDATWDSTKGKYYSPSLGRWYDTPYKRP